MTPQTARINEARIVAFARDVLAASKGPGAVDLSHLRPSLAGISPDGKWLYVVLFSENGSTRGRFGVFRRDPASGNLELQEGGPDSDADILVEFEQPVGFFAFARLQRYLEGILERPVDLVTPGAIRPEMRAAILGEALYAA